MVREAQGSFFQYIHIDEDSMPFNDKLIIFVFAQLCGQCQYKLDGIQIWPFVAFLVSRKKFKTSFSQNSLRSFIFFC